MKRLNLLLASSITLLALTSCTKNIDKETYEITDMLGRNVEVPVNVDRVLCIGAGSLRLFSYFDAMDKLCAVENIEKTRTGAVSIRPYQLAHEDYFKTLPSCGAGGPSGSAEAETILTCNPDVIFSLYTQDSKAMDLLQAQTSIPVVTLSYGDVAPYSDELYSSIKLMGRIINETERANELCDYINDIKTDISTRTKDILDEDKPSIYLGCNSSWGTHGIESTSPNYIIFNTANIKNAATDYIKLNNIQGTTLEMEALVSINPDKIILDVGGINILRNQYKTNKNIIDSLDAIAKGEIYLQMPYNAYYTNIELALVNNYYAASIAYPNQFNDINFETKANEILTFMLGSSVYDTIKEELYGGYQQINNLEEFLAR